MHPNILSYNGQNIEQRTDGYVNATQMAKANNVSVNDWYKINETKSYIKELNSETNIFGLALYIVSTDSLGVKTTWVHPLLALNFGRWISSKFAIWCDTHIKTLIETGSTTLAQQSNITRSPLMFATLALHQALILYN